MTWYDRFISMCVVNVVILVCFLVSFCCSIWVTEERQLAQDQIHIDALEQLPMCADKAEEEILKSALSGGPEVWYRYIDRPEMLDTIISRSSRNYIYFTTALLGLIGFICFVRWIDAFT